MLKNTTLLFMLSLNILVLVACKQSLLVSEVTGTPNLPLSTASRVPTPVPTVLLYPTETRNSENISPTQPAPTPLKIETSIYAVPNVPTGYIFDIYWDETSKVVFFNVDNEAGEQALWAYDVSDEITYMTDSQLVTDEQNTIDSPPIPLNMPTNIPSTLELVTISPSGQKAIFFQGVGIPTPTPPPNPDGEISTESYIANVWLWNQDTTRELGQIEVCSRNKYLWTTDEHLVAIQASSFPSSCRQANAWLVDAINDVVIELLPFDVYHGQAELVSFSPNEAKLLFLERGINDTGRFQHLQIIDIETIQVSKLDVPTLTNPIGWIDNDRILIFFKNYSEEIWKLAVFDIRENELEELLDYEVYLTEFGGEFIREAMLSPDKQWLAFSVDRDPYKESSLWLLEISPNG